MSRIRVASGKRSDGFIRVTIFKRSSKKDITSPLLSDKEQRELSPVQKLIAVYEILLNSSLLSVLEQNQKF